MVVYERGFRHDDDLLVPFAVKSSTVANVPGNLAVLQQCVVPDNMCEHP